MKFKENNDFYQCYLECKGKKYYVAKVKLVETKLYIRIFKQYSNITRLPDYIYEDFLIKFASIENYKYYSFDFEIVSCYH